MGTAKKVKEYPHELVKWVLQTVTAAIDSRSESIALFDACLQAVAIVTFPEKFSASDHVSFVFDTLFDFFIITTIFIPLCRHFFSFSAR